MKRVATIRTTFLAVVVATAPNLLAVSCYPKPESNSGDPHATSTRATTAMPLQQRTRHDELVNAVGERAIEIVVEAERVLVGELSLVSADEAALPDSLAASDRVAGYPAATGLQPLDAILARSQIEALLDWDNYDPSWRSRCKIDRIHGFRFIRGDERVDIALTDPCWLAIWSFRRGAQVDRWAAAFNVDLGPKLVALDASRVVELPASGQ